jgi:hypothetical protein
MLPEHRLALQQREAALKRKIREMYHLGQSEMKPIGVPIEIPPEEYEQIMAYFLEPDTLEGCLERVASEGSLLPNVALAKDVARQTFESGFLSARLPVGTISEDMSVAEAISDDERFQAQVDLHLLMQIEMTSHFILSELFTRLCDQKGLNADSLWQYLDEWGLIDEDNLEIIRVGLERYCDEDYVSALHILATQFEDVLRTAFEKDGAPVIKPRKGQRGWQFETLGDFLQHDFVKKAIPLDLLEYIRLVLADPIGGNLRNRVAHGLIHPQECTKPVVDIVLHLFLILTRFRVSAEFQVQTEEEI